MLDNIENVFSLFTKMSELLLQTHKKLIGQQEVKKIKNLSNPL